MFDRVATLALPVVIIALAFSIVALISLTARRPATRKHCLNVLSEFAVFAAAARGRVLG